MRGRIQVEWRCANQVRAETQRDWLALQFQGRGFVTEAPVQSAFYGHKQLWLTTCNVAFNTTQDGDTIKTLVSSRQNSDPFILAGSWWQHHACPHDEGVNSCVATRTVK